MSEKEDIDFTTVYMSGFYDGEKKWKDKIRNKIEEVKEGIDIQYQRLIINVLEDLLKEN